MSKSNVFEGDLLKLIFNATAIAGLAENHSSSPVTDLYISLHSADPGEAGDQASNEATFGGYARVAVARTTSGWAVTGGSVSPVTPITFPACTSGTQTITHMGIGTSLSGAGKLLYSGIISPSIAVTTGVIPELSTSTVITED